ncbi:hypothetical protein PFICI_03076 [Pestalotiopsis fici W106-1]|uniref:Enoyl reductase (ER) domain-containing protein n=1 Tax=Pestalotiopsis fici (strain W106-1 / CGMCC3.15140) TaxID=1229662 RepID=W3XIH4_PESFW|nr:uncharacterized protein PFICI_03076 [Pestalotiopsis fici W106-1]ETS85051.1 hypothetical protein PFICI_03076 [Pestalotiopsis fici W106-1]
MASQATARQSQTMRAVVCDKTGPVNVLHLRDIPIPSPGEGQVLLQVLGFGINRAEMYTRQGHSPGVTFPRILGIECIGTVVAYHDTASQRTIKYPLGTRVATCMGGLGRQIPGSYAQYTCVAEANMRPIPPTNLPISVLAALPEMLQTTWGSLVQGLDLKAGQSLLIRGATSSIGLCAIQLARRLGASRIAATTRSLDREQMLRDAGADEVLIDDGKIADQILMSSGSKGPFNVVLELVGATTVRDSLKCVVPKGTVCVSGMQSGEWIVDDLDLFMDLPNRARLCVYGGGPEDFMMMPFEALIRDVEAGRVKIPVKTFQLDEIQKVHEILEAGGGGAKMAVVVDEA